MPSYEQLSNTMVNESYYTSANLSLTRIKTWSVNKTLNVISLIDFWFFKIKILEKKTQL